MAKVTSAQLIREFGRYHDAALKETVTVTKHGRDSVVMLSAEEYRRLKLRDRQALRAEELGEEFLEVLTRSEMSAEHAHLDGEIDG
jgi:prevent-host-death family protein